MLNTEPNPKLSQRIADGHPLPLSNGEINFLWWFIQGGIMCSATRERLYKGWGMCERHAWGFVTVEAAFRMGYMHGPAILYEDLMNQAEAAFHSRGPLQIWRSRTNIRQRGPCMMCEMGYGPHSKGNADKDRVDKGRDLSELKALAGKTAPFWQKALCGRCAGNDSSQRCRTHLIEDLSQGVTTELPSHVALVAYIAKHIRIYAKSFCWGYQGTETEEDAAALISAIGWCSGWHTFLEMMK
jgi:hypothetical protein